jgi:hypothetical protein
MAAVLVAILPVTANLAKGTKRMENQRVTLIAIIARYYPPTNYRGSKIRAWRADENSKKGVCVPYDGGEYANFDKAAGMLADQFGWDFSKYIRGSLGNGEFVYVKKPEW